MPKKNFLTYLFNPVCVLITRLVPANLGIVAIDIGGKEPRHVKVDTWKSVKACILIVQLIFLGTTCILI